MALPSAYVAHSVASRVRLHIPAKKGDALYFSGLAAALKSVGGINAVRVNAVAASVLILHSEECNLKSIAEFARRHRQFNLQSNPLKPQRTLGELVADQIQQTDRLIATGSRGHLDAQSIFFLLFLGLGLSQLWRGQIMQPAIPLLWRAWEILKQIGNSTK